MLSKESKTRGSHSVRQVWRQCNTTTKRPCQVPTVLALTEWYVPLNTEVFHDVTEVVLIAAYYTHSRLITLLKCHGYLDIPCHQMNITSSSDYCKMRTTALLSLLIVSILVIACLAYR